MLEHDEGFELETEFEKIWDKIRYKKIDKIYEITEDIISILKNHISDEMLFHMDYQKIQNLFLKAKRANFFYYSGDAKNLIIAANPKYKDIFKRRKCIRKLKYTGEEIDDDVNTGFERGKIYTSTHYNGATYTIDINGEERIIGNMYFERVT